MANKRRRSEERISDETLKQRIKYGWLNLCLSLPLIFAGSYYGWIHTKFFFDFGYAPELVHYSPMSICATSLIFVLLPLYLVNVWYIVMRRPMPNFLHKFLGKMLGVIFVLFFLQIVPFHFWATNYLEDNGYVFCSERSTVRGIQVYALDENLCLK